MEIITRDSPAIQLNFIIIDLIKIWKIASIYVVLIFFLAIPVPTFCAKGEILMRIPFLF